MKRILMALATLAGLGLSAGHAFADHGGYAPPGGPGAGASPQSDRSVDRTRCSARAICRRVAGPTCTACTPASSASSTSRRAAGADSRVPSRHGWRAWRQGEPHYGAGYGTGGPGTAPNGRSHAGHTRLPAPPLRSQPARLLHGRCEQVIDTVVSRRPVSATTGRRSFPGFQFLDGLREWPPESVPWLPLDSHSSPPLPAPRRRPRSTSRSPVGTRT